MHKFIMFVVWCDFGILRMFQIFSDKVQDVCGVNNFWLAKLCAKITFSIAVIDYLHYFFINVTVLKIILGSVIFLCVHLALFVAFCKEAERLDAQYRNGQFYLNSLAVMMIPVRALGVFTFFFTLSYCGTLSHSERLLIYTFMLVEIGGVLCTLYFLSCTPKPPAKSKVRALMEKIAAKTRAIFAPQPTPEPC